jgi:transcriptional regulator with XRE-family HTH domain
LIDTDEIIVLNSVKLSNRIRFTMMLFRGMGMVSETRLRGDRLRQLREKQGFSREKLAELLQIGTNPIYQYETEKSDPSSTIVAKIAQLFCVSTDYLFGLTDDPSPKIEGELSPKEAAAIAAWRRGERLEAVKVIATDE